MVEYAVPSLCFFALSRHSFVMMSFIKPFLPSLSKYVTIILFSSLLNTVLSVILLPETMFSDLISPSFLVQALPWFAFLCIVSSILLCTLAIFYLSATQYKLCSYRILIPMSAWSLLVPTLRSLRYVIISSRKFNPRPIFTYVNTAFHAGLDSDSIFQDQNQDLKVQNQELRLKQQHKLN